MHMGHPHTGDVNAMPQEPQSGDPVLICIIRSHRNAIGRPLEDHWKHIGNALATNNSFSSGIQVHTGVYSPGTLDSH